MTKLLREVEPAATLDARGICDELGRVVASPAFRNAPRLSAFLRFVVEMALAGRGDRIKGYTIAVGALGRGEGFDPQTDPIVRVEAGRLRLALGRFYAGEGRGNPVVIELPRGRYVPRFRRRAGAAPAPITPRAIVAALERLMEMHRLEAEALAAEIAATERTLNGKPPGVADAISAAGPARGPRRSAIRPR